jgi:hypothetical protein
MYFASARLYTHIMYFFDSSETDLRKSRIMKACASAAILISIASNADVAINAMLYTTYYHIRMLLLAVMVIVKVSRSSYAGEIGVEALKANLNKGNLLISRCSVANNDTAGKAGRMIAQMWHGGSSSEREEPPKLLVKSRLGARFVLSIPYCALSI